MPGPQRENAPRTAAGLRLAVSRLGASLASQSVSKPKRQVEARRGLLAPDLVEVRIHLDSEAGLIEARRQGRDHGARAGFPATDLAMIVAIVSELGRNILLFAGQGDITIAVTQDGQRPGVTITAQDTGPGIVDVERALRDGFSTAGRPGLGLGGVRRLADEFEVRSLPARGTTVLVRKWRP